MHKAMRYMTAGISEPNTCSSSHPGEHRARQQLRRVEARRREGQFVATVAAGAVWAGTNATCGPSWFDRETRLEDQEGVDPSRRVVARNGWRGAADTTTALLLGLNREVHGQGYTD